MISVSPYIIFSGCVILTLLLAGLVFSSARSNLGPKNSFLAALPSSLLPRNITTVTAPLASPTNTTIKLMVPSIPAIAVPNDRDEHSNINETTATAYRAFVEDLDATMQRDKLVTQLMDAAQNSPPVDIVASRHSRVCQWRKDGYLLHLVSCPKTASQIVTNESWGIMVSPPFLYRTSTVSPPAVHHSPAYPQLAMSMQTFEWWLHQPRSFTLLLVNTSSAPQVKAPGTICSFLTMHWAAETFGFRAVVEPNGSVVWPTCAKNAQSCRQVDPTAPPQDGPVCCAHAINEALVDLQSVLKPRGVPLFLLSGTLLGAARNGKIIPWDADSDVAVADHPWFQWLDRKFPKKYMATQQMHMCRTCPFFHRLFPIWPYRSHPNHLASDIQSRLEYLHLYKDLYYKAAYADVITEKHRTCVPVTLEGVQYCSPGPPEEVCFKNYGSGWRTPDKNFSLPFPYGNPNEAAPGHVEWPPLFFREQKAYEPKKKKYFNSLAFLMSKCGRTKLRNVHNGSAGST